MLIEASLRRDVPDEAEGGEDWGGFDEELPARPISRSIGSDVRRGKREPKIIIKDEPKKQREKKQKSRKGQNTSVDRNDFGLLNEEGDSEVDGKYAKKLIYIYYTDMISLCLVSSRTVL